VRDNLVFGCCDCTSHDITLLSYFDEFQVKAAKTVEEARFEYVTGKYRDYGKIFRKRK
jgi:hypothetical protein